MPSQETNSTLNWSIPVTFVLSSVISIVATVMYFRYAATRATGVPPPPSGPVSLIKDTISYLPHILLLFGVIADMLTYEGVYSIASFIGLLSIPINWFFKFFWSGILDGLFGLAALASGQQPPAPVQAQAQAPAQPSTGKLFETYNTCEVQGFGGMRSPFAPQTLVVTATVFFYYVFDIINNRGWVNATATFLLFFVLYGAQMFVMDDCSKADDTVKNKWLKGAIAFFEGLFIGGTSYAVVQANYPNRLPSSIVSPFPRKTRSDLKEGKEGKFVDGDGNPYVCLANGQCYPDMSSNESRKAFAEIASRNLGTGSAPVTTCSGS